MSLRTGDKKETSLNEVVVSDTFLQEYLRGQGVNFKPTGKEYVLKPKENKASYTDFRTIYPSKKPFEKPGDFKKKRKRGRPKKVGRPKK